MQEEYSFSDFEIITLNPNEDYQTSDDEDESDYELMDFENNVACHEVTIFNSINNDIDKVKLLSTEAAEAAKTTNLDKNNELKKYVDHIEVKQNEYVEDKNCVTINNDDYYEDEVMEEDAMQLHVNNISIAEIVKPRKKFNLEEYKIHRANKPLPTIIEKNVVLELCEMPETLPLIELPTDPRSIKHLMSKTNKKNEPSTEDYIVDINSPSNSSSINKEEEKEKNEIETQTIHPDYEEIVLYDISVNTDISISPHEDDSEKKSSSTKFLTNIVNSFQQSTNPMTILNSSTSLLSSINALLTEKRSSPSDDVNIKTEIDEHGENKVIMHLRKDRLRPFRSSSGVQTEITPLFPPLILSPSLIFNRIKNARNFRRKSSRSRSRSRSISPEPEYYNRRNNYKYSRSVNSSSMNSSESSDSDTSAYSSCRSSDSIRRFENRPKRGYQRPNFNYQEERKIIYVGGLFEETTKDELRRKFLKYGTIKKISIHAKNDGSLRYGFVTFAEASVAYDVLDRFNNDPCINCFDLRFGGRRKFCRQSYADLDSCNHENEDIYSNDSNNNNGKSKSNELSFEDLLNMTKRKLCKNK